MHYDSNEKYPVVLLFHGLTASLKSNEMLANSFASSGAIAIAIDFRGHGKSGGEFPFDNVLKFNATFGDAMGIIRYINNRSDIDMSRVSAFGISLGGGAALYLALNNLVNNYVVTYPGIAYLWNNIELYKYNFTDLGSSAKGAIIAGTADECERCLPEYVEHFITNNPEIKIKWNEGASHGDSDFYYKDADYIGNLAANEWGLERFTTVKMLYYSGYIGIGLLVLFLGSDLLTGLIIFLKSLLKSSG